MLRKVKELSAEDKNAIVKLFEVAINRLEISRLGDKLTTTVYIFLNKGNNKITELRTILQRESQNS